MALDTEAGVGRLGSYVSAEYPGVVLLLFADHIRVMAYSSNLKMLFCGYCCIPIGRMRVVPVKAILSCQHACLELNKAFQRVILH